MDAVCMYGLWTKTSLVHGHREQHLDDWNCQHPGVPVREATKLWNYGRLLVPVSTSESVLLSKYIISPSLHATLSILLFFADLAYYFFSGCFFSVHLVSSSFLLLRCVYGRVGVDCQDPCIQTSSWLPFFALKHLNFLAFRIHSQRTPFLVFGRMPLNP